MTKERAGDAKSVFRFGIQGSVAMSTHFGIPWLCFIRRELGTRILFWPFDGWKIPTGYSAIAEVYPTLSSRGFAGEGRTGDYHDLEHRGLASPRRSGWQLRRVSESAADATRSDNGEDGGLDIGSGLAPAKFKITRFPSGRDRRSKKKQSKKFHKKF